MRPVKRALCEWTLLCAAPAWLALACVESALRGATDVRTAPSVELAEFVSPSCTTAWGGAARG